MKEIPPCWPHCLCQSLILWHTYRAAQGWLESHGDLEAGEIQMGLGFTVQWEGLQPGGLLWVLINMDQSEGRRLGSARLTLAPTLLNRRKRRSTCCLWTI